MQTWTIQDFERLDIPKIQDVSRENAWIVLWLDNGMRIKFPNW